MVNHKREMVNNLRGTILKALRASPDYVSGEVLSGELGVSRTSIWKHVHDLKAAGYGIETSPQGYRLISSPDLLLPCEFSDLTREIQHFQEIGSTMDVARELARNGAVDGTIVIAETQSRGRGRLGREWVSPEGGIYLTLILRPRISPTYAPRLNLVASVAVATTIRTLFGLKAELKWPNDVLIEGKKICGILAELDAEVDMTNFVNVGIGINANASISEFETATSLKKVVGREISRKQFLSSLLTEMNRQQDLLTKQDLLEEWKKLSATLNKQVKIVAPGETIEGQAVDIDTNGALLVKTRDGSIITAIAGDCVHLL